MDSRILCVRNTGGVWRVSFLSTSSPRTWNKLSVSSFWLELPSKRDLLSALSLFLPHCSFLFPSFTFSRSLLTLLRQSAQPQGQRTEGLACVFVKEEESESRGRQEREERWSRWGTRDGTRLANREQYENGRKWQLRKLSIIKHIASLI